MEQIPASLPPSNSCTASNVVSSSVGSSTRMKDTHELPSYQISFIRLDAVQNFNQRKKISVFKDDVKNAIKNYQIIFCINFKNEPTVGRQGV